MVHVDVLVLCSVHLPYSADPSENCSIPRSTAAKAILSPFCILMQTKFYHLHSPLHKAEKKTNFKVGLSGHITDTAVLMAWLYRDEDDILDQLYKEYVRIFIMMI